MTPAPVIEGLAAPFGEASTPIFGDFTEIFAPGAFKATLADAAAGRRNIEAVWAHRQIVFGSTGGGQLRLWEDRDGLRFALGAGRMDARRLEVIGMGNVKVSVAFHARKDEWGPGRRRRVIFAADLEHVSLITWWPAYSGTWARLREAA